jgi:hypothetical protein
MAATDGNSATQKKRHNVDTSNGAYPPSLVGISILPYIASDSYADGIVDIQNNPPHVSNKQNFLN